MSEDAGSNAEACSSGAEVSDQEIKEEANPEAEKDITITLEENIDTDNIDQLHTALKSALSPATESVTLDAEDLETIDFSGLQLFAAFIATTNASSIKVSWENIPIPLFEAATDLDMCEAIGF